jgi:hypothetical protein
MGTLLFSTWLAGGVIGAATNTSMVAWTLALWVVVFVGLYATKGA